MKKHLLTASLLAVFLVGCSAEDVTNKIKVNVNEDVKEASVDKNTNDNTNEDNAKANDNNDKGNSHRISKSDKGKGSSCEKVDVEDSKDVVYQQMFDPSTDVGKSYANIIDTQKEMYETSKENIKKNEKHIAEYESDIEKYELEIKELEKELVTLGSDDSKRKTFIEGEINLKNLSISQNKDSIATKEKLIASEKEYIKEYDEFEKCYGGQ